MGERFIYWNEGLVFIGILTFIVGVPCFAVAMLGTRLINHIGRYPTKSARLQMGICIQLLVLEIFSFFLLALFFHVFSD
jgi:hypothetical protein